MSNEEDAAVKRGTRNGVIFLAVVLLIAVAIGGFFYKKHLDDQRDVAEIYCTMQPGIPSIYSPEFKNCVDQYLR